jgi:hypothetical protein
VTMVTLILVLGVIATIKHILLDTLTGSLNKFGFQTIHKFTK